MNEQSDPASELYRDRALHEGTRTTLGPSTTLVQGKAAVRGTHIGIARVRSDGDDVDDLQKGDVLVCPAISPAWSTIFARIGAMVTDAGGILSNPAIVAREHGVPTVMATGTGTTLIRDGQRVAVDGQRGVVLILS
jgi:phosphohistidine swiveling domain-containing protein